MLWVSDAISAQTSLRWSLSNKPLLTLIFTRPLAESCWRISSSTVSLKPPFPMRTLGRNSREVASLSTSFGMSVRSATSTLTMVLWPSAKTADCPACQTRFDSHAVLDSNTKSVAGGLMGPTFSAHALSTNVRK